MNIVAVKNYFLSLQSDICTQLETIESQGKFETHEWARDILGGGQARVLENGAVIEKAGVNFSHVGGSKLPPSATAHRPELVGRSYQAMGVSVVVHPQNPYAPTSHANVRFFIAETPGEPPIWWFGGGFDLTPYYGFEEDCIAWHQHAQHTLNQFDPSFYAKFKHWCDDYFYIKHRQEHRGIGGIFFDDFNELGFDQSFAMTQAVGQAFIDSYIPILRQRKDTLFEDRQRQFQLYRRGRYVEFNLVYDRGTLFGLQSNGRTESILISMPPMVSWKYDWSPEPETEEIKLYERFLPPKDWVNLNSAHNLS